MKRRDDRAVAVPTHIGPGCVLSDRFQLLEPIGSGGMAVVWRAEDRTLGIPVALKMLRPVDVHSPIVRARFEKEARAVAALEHPNVVHILEYGVHGDLPYLAMELLEGETLASRLERETTLDATSTVWVVEQVAQPVDMAHAYGIIHRDIKPENIFLQASDNGPVPKLLDFGIAKLIDGDKNDSLTRTDAVIGTTHYLSPERARGKKPLDGRVDLWALAVVVYECLVGKRPFDEHVDDLLALLRAIAEVDYPPPSILAPVPPALDAWMDQALNPNPERRFATASDMASALRDALLPGTIASTTDVSFEPTTDDAFPQPPPSHASADVDAPPSSARIDAMDRPSASEQDAILAPAEQEAEPAVNLPPAARAVHDVRPIANETVTTSMNVAMNVAMNDEPAVHDARPVITETVPSSLDVPGIDEPSARELSRNPAVPAGRDWRLFAAAAISMMAASGVGVSLVRMVTPRSHHANPAVAMIASSSPAHTVLPMPSPTSPPVIAVSALPPVSSDSPPIVDIERLPVPDAQPPSVPTTLPRSPHHNARRSKAPSEPHNVFGL